MKLKMIEVDGSREEIESFADRFIRRPNQNEETNVRESAETIAGVVALAEEQQRFVTVVSKFKDKRFRLSDVGKITGRVSRGSQWSFIKSLEKLSVVRCVKRGRGRFPSVYELA
ncbi:MAG: hypothetical protein KBT68_02360 [bacterium]|nr:hypothetical protein [Candidatus Colisoma equi]